MFKTHLRQVGGSVMLTVPPMVLKQLDLHAGQSVGLEVDHGRLVVEPTPRLRYALDDLLAQCEAMAGFSEEENSWLSNPPSGRELI